MAKESKTTLRDRKGTYRPIHEGGRPATILEPMFVPPHCVFHSTAFRFYSFFEDAPAVVENSNRTGYPIFSDTNYLILRENVMFN
jgi:hypothetical protein